MFVWLGQYITKTVVTALAVVASLGAGIWFWRHPESLVAIWTVVKYAAVWIGTVLVLPWATFFVTRWVVSLESNRAAALMLLGYLFVNMMIAIWLMGGLSGHDTLTWGVVLLGFLAAGVYNFKVCEYLAGLMEDS